MLCPSCQTDLTTYVASEFGKLGGVAAMAALTKRQRIAKARKAGAANAGIPKTPSLTRGEAMRAAWARGDFANRTKKQRVARARKAAAASAIVRAAKAAKPE